jgi:hypothetical protein
MLGQATNACRHASLTGMLYADHVNGYAMWQLPGQIREKRGDKMLQLLKEQSVCLEF